MIAYSIKSVLCLLVLWGFYKVALESLAAHRLKRVYLLGSLLFSLTLPLFTITYEVKAEPQPASQNATYFAPSDTFASPISTEEKTNYVPYILFSIYGLGVLFFGYRFARNLYRIRSNVRSSEKRRCIDHTKVLLKQKTVPHSFLRFIFLSQTDFHNHKIAPEILEHELVHVTQKHSWDILAVEFLQVLFWFNPLLFWFKKSIALNHEFLADQKAMHNKNDVEHYTKLLFQYSGGVHHTALSSPINYSLTRPPYNRAKKRIIMLSQTFSAKKMAARLAFLLPVLALCIYFFNQDIVAKPVIQEEQQKQETQEPFVYKNEGSLRKNMVIKQKDLKRYAPNLGTDTLEKIIPTSAQLKDWQNATKYGVWIDGKRIENSVLATKSTSDFDQYFVSKLEKNARTPEGTSFQVNLMTPSYYEKHKVMDAMVTNKQIQEYLTLKTNIQSQFEGTWKSSKKNIEFKIHDQNGGLLWDIIENGDTSVRYYPKESEDGLYFTQGTQDIYYTVEGKTMKDSEGNTYLKTQNAQKKLTIYIIDEKISVNGKGTRVENFTKTVNAITEDWTREEMMNYTIQLRAKNGVDDLVGKLNKEFHKTKLYKTNPSQELIPPPPPPAPVAPQVPTAPPVPIRTDVKEIQMAIKEKDILLNDKKIEVGDFAKSLNKITTNWTPEELKTAIVLFKTKSPDEKIKTQLEAAYKTTELYKAQPSHGLIPPPPPGYNDRDIKIEIPTPPAPPAPPSPAEMIKKMTAAGADFYYNGDKISAEKAKELFKTKNSLNMMSTDTKTGAKPMVLITDN